MKVLMISGDKNLLKPGRDAASRLEWQRKAVEKVDVYVWPKLHSLGDIWRSARHGGHSVVTTQDPFWRGLIAWLVARRHNMSLNVQVHADMSGQSFIKRMLGRFVLKRADSIRVVSKRVEEQVKKTCTKARTHVLPIYIDLDRFREIKRLPHERLTILWVGRFEKEKDPVQAVKVLKAVREQGVDAALVMLGAGLQEQVVREAARGLPVEFPGWKPPEEYLNVADVVLSTSLHESWGASIIEALAAGVPVVAPDVGIAKEAGAIVVKRSDLANAVAEVLHDKPQSELKITFLDREEWAIKWKETLA